MNSNKKMILIPFEKYECLKSNVNKDISTSDVGLQTDELNDHISEQKEESDRTQKGNGEEYNGEIKGKEVFDEQNKYEINMKIPPPGEPAKKKIRWLKF